MSRSKGEFVSGADAATDRPSVVPLVPKFLADQTTCMLVKIGQISLRLADRRLAEFGLRTRHYSMLQTIIEDGPMSQQELGHRLRIDKATMVASIDLLESAGLVERQRVATDRKRYALLATAHGRDQAEKATSSLHALDDELLADLDPQQFAALREIIATVNAGPTLASAFDRSRS